MFGDWPNLAELSIARGIFRIEPSYSNSNNNSDDESHAVCPLKKLSLEVIRLDGRLFHALQGAQGTLTHLSFVKVGVIQLADLCRVLTGHGGSLLDLRIISCRIANGGHDSDFDDSPNDNQGDSWGSASGNDDNWTTSGGNDNRKLGAFEKALSACLNLTHLSIEPGCIPVDSAPVNLFRPLAKLETLEWNSKHIKALQPPVWFSLLGLGPVLLEQKRKLKSRPND